MYSTSYVAVLLLLLGVLGAPFEFTQGAAAPAVSTDGCGKDTFAFGCHAYLIGGGEEAGNPAALAGRGVQTVTLDPTKVSAAAIAQMNKSGPIPILYTNAFWQNGMGPRPSRCLSNGVARRYGECMIDPRSPEFYPHFQRQLAKVKALGGSYIEIDNMDAYVQKGFVDDVVRLIQLAANAGVNVLSKNETNEAILKLPNVVGAIVEAGNKGSAAYRNAFNAVGKKCAGVVMINASEGKSSDPYVSYTTGSHPNYQGKGCDGKEYQKFCGCSPNSAGPRIAGTPAAVGDIPIPPPTPGEQTPSINNQPTALAGGSPQSSSGSGSPATQQLPLQQPQPQQFPPYQPKQEQKKTETVIAKKEEPKKEVPKKEAEQKTGFEKRTKVPTKKQNAVLTNPLGVGDVSGEESTIQELPAVTSFGGARLSCTPKDIPLGTRAVLSWVCRNANESVITASDRRVSISTDGRTLGSAKVIPKMKTRFVLSCLSDGEEVGSASCVIETRKSQAAPALPFGATSKPVEESQPKCFFGFCM